MPVVSLSRPSRELEKGHRRGPAPPRGAAPPGPADYQPDGGGKTFGHDAGPLRRHPPTLKRAPAVRQTRRIRYVARFHGTRFERFERSC